MKIPLKFNADYESVLFHGKGAPAVINQALEFLLLYLEDAPLYTTKKYSEEFLNHIEEVSGRKPQLAGEGACQNWWGDLKDIPLERKVNSKEMSSVFIDDARIITDIHSLEIDSSKKYLAKPLSEMSGRGFCVFDSQNLREVDDLLKRNSPLVIEPYLDRKFDFSHYILPEKDICYENIVDSRFQYKGTIFRDLRNPTIESLSFYHKLKESEWERFKKIYQKIKATYAEARINNMFSIDSFIYSEEGILKVRPITEVNVRKTMGYIAWKFSEKYAKDSVCSQFLLARKTGEMKFSDIQKKAASVGAIYLSPGDTRFEIFFLMAESEETGREKLNELKRLLTDTEFPV